MCPFWARKANGCPSGKRVNDYDSWKRPYKQDQCFRSYRCLTSCYSPETGTQALHICNVTKIKQLEQRGNRRLDSGARVCSPGIPFGLRLELICLSLTHSNMYMPITEAEVKGNGVAPIKRLNPLFRWQNLPLPCHTWHGGFLSLL
jgi:hypothetical protein